jgi:hypothetical protein
MKPSLALLAILLFVTTAHAKTISYTGIIFEVKHRWDGSVTLYMDGHQYFDAKMVLRVPREYASNVGALPSEGTKVTARGTLLELHNKPVIMIYRASQWKW